MRGKQGKLLFDNEDKDMNEIYWITRLDIIICLAGVVTFICVFVAIGLGIAWFTDGEDELLMSNETRKRIAKAMLIPLVISTLIWTFVPNSKTALMIFGLGSTVDYIKENDTLQGIPDKCVKALDVWVDSLVEEE